MTVRTRAQLNSDADSLLPDNTAGEISPADVRGRVKDLADSALLAEDVGTAAAADTGDFAAASHGHTLSDISDAGTAAAANTGDFATAAQGGKADSALQTGSHAAVSVIGRSANSSGDAADIAAGANDRILARVSNALSWVQLTIGMIPDSLITYAKIASGAIGTTAGTLAAGDDSRITGAVQKAGSGQTLTGSYLHTVYNYGNLGSTTITLNPANGLTGKITRNSGSGTIAAPSGTPSGVYNMVIFIDGTSSTGSTSLSGFANSDYGDDPPGSGQHAWLYVTVGPDAKTAKIEAIDY